MVRSFGIRDWSRARKRSLDSLREVELDTRAARSRNRPFPAQLHPACSTVQPKLHLVHQPKSRLKAHLAQRRERRGGTTSASLTSRWFGQRSSEANSNQLQAAALRGHETSAAIQQNDNVQQAEYVEFDLMDWTPTYEYLRPETDSRSEPPVAERDVEGVRCRVGSISLEDHFTIGESWASFVDFLDSDIEMEDAPPVVVSEAVQEEECEEAGVQGNAVQHEEVNQALNGVEGKQPHVTEEYNSPRPEPSLNTVARTALQICGADDGDSASDTVDEEADNEEEDRRKRRASTRASSSTRQPSNQRKKENRRKKNPSSGHSESCVLPSNGASEPPDGPFPANTSAHNTVPTESYWQELFGEDGDE